MDDSRKYIFVIATIIFNMVVGIVDRVLQVVYYCLTKKWGNKDSSRGFQTTSVKNTALTFCILPSALNCFMIAIYCIFHYEKMLTPKVKIKNFFMYVISCEFLYPVGVHKSFKTKYSENADNPIVTLRLINAIHVMFVSLPQLLIVSINSSARGDFKGVDIASLVFSCFFIVWSVGYYFICVSKDSDYDDYITVNTYKEKSD